MLLLTRLLACALARLPAYSLTCLLAFLWFMSSADRSRLGVVPGFADLVVYVFCRVCPVCPALGLGFVGV